MLLYGEDRELQIKLTELEMKMQRNTTEYSIYSSIVLSSMVVMVITLYTWAITINDISYVYFAFPIAIFFFLVWLITHLVYTNRLDELEGNIQELKKQYAW